MSEPGNSPGRDDPAGPPEQPTLSRRRGRALILSTVLGVTVFLIAFLLLVSQCGTGDGRDGDGGGGGVYGAPAADAQAVDLR